LAADQSSAGQTVHAVQDDSNPSGVAAQFVPKQSLDEWRAPKLIGVAVYGPDNKKIGTIKDIMIGHDGAARSVVIAVGGFLGLGEKEVAVPFSAVQWRTEKREVVTEQPSPTMPNAATGDARPKTKTVDPAATEANQGYPDRALLNMTFAQLKAAPDFKYAPNPTAQTDSASQNLEQKNEVQSSSPRP
jgi:hypothetical protein